MDKVPATEVVIQGLDSIVPPSFSPIESLKQIISEDGVITMVSDQFLLLNAERLKNVLGEDTYRAYIASLSASGPSPYRELSAKLSDDQLLDSVKSRYIQAPCEIRDYIDGLDDHLQDLKHTIESQVAAAQTEKSATADSSQSNSSE